MKAVYIGAGTDVSPIKFLRNVKDFVYIDCQPFSEFGTKVHKCTPGWCSEKCVGFSRPRFLPRLKESMERIGMKYRKISDNELEFTNERGQRVTYFINTAMPDHINRVKRRIRNFDNLIVMGHNPDSTALEHTDRKITFWGNTATAYQNCTCDDSDSKDNVIWRLNREDETRKKFYWFNVIDGNKVHRFDRWSNFIYHLDRRSTSVTSK